jgi:hypothetical protein
MRLVEMNGAVAAREDGPQPETTLIRCMDGHRPTAKGVYVSILWIILIIVIVLALLGFLGRGAW